MNTVHLDIAETAPPPRPSLRLGRAWGLGRWLRLLGDISLALVATIGGSADRRQHPGQPARVDFDRVWRLVERAILWTWALRARLRAEARAARVGRPPEVRDYDGPENLLLHGSSAAMALAKACARHADCIEGRATAEVAAQICADLGVAATLLGMTDEAWKLVAINHAVRELLGGPDEAVVPGPFSGARAAAVETARPATTPAGTMRVNAPETG